MTGLFVVLAFLLTGFMLLDSRQAYFLPCIRPAFSP
jgi:hypothetical protein